MSAADERSILASGERTGVISLLLLFVAVIAGGVVLWRQASRRIADKGFGFAVHSEIGEVMRERQYSETEISGTISGGGSINIGGTPSMQPTSGYITSKTTRYQEIFLRMPSGKEQVLEFVDFNVPCRESHKISLLAVQRSGSPRYICGYHNHATDENIVFRKRILAAVQPPRTGPAWIGWLLFFMATFFGLLWFSGVVFGEDDLAVEVISLAIIAAVPTGIISLITRFRSKRVTRSHVPVVIDRVSEVIAENEQALNAAS